MQEGFLEGKINQRKTRMGLMISAKEPSCKDEPEELDNLKSDGLENLFDFGHPGSSGN